MCPSLKTLHRGDDDGNGVQLGNVKRDESKELRGRRRNQKEVGGVNKIQYGRGKKGEY